MSMAHVFVETNFLYSVYRMPSQRRDDALALHSRFQEGEIKLHVPYLCFQEVRNLIGKNLPKHRCEDLQDFHKFAVAQGTAQWDYEEVKKLVDAALGEVSRTKAVYKRELADFADALGEGVLHGTAGVFDFLESLELDDDSLKYNDKLILSSVLVKAKELHGAGVSGLFFASTDTSDLRPTSQRPRLTQYYRDAGLTFVPGFVIPDPPPPSPLLSPPPTLP